MSDTIDCPYYKQCGGCSFRDVSYKKQLETKEENVRKLLKGICRVESIAGMKNPNHYRNKVHAVFDRDRKGNIISGVYAEKTHRVIDVKNCLIEDEIADSIIQDIKKMLKSFKIKTYDEDTEYGLLRHVLVKRAFATGEVMVVLVLASPILPSSKNFTRELLKIHPEITTIIINVNNRHTSMVLGDKETVLYGKGYITDVLCGKKFKISSKSFYQVNPVQTEILYSKAIELAGLTGKERIIDAYCGIGTIGIIASDHAGEVISVELNRDAVKDAVANCKMNNIKNVSVYCNDAGKFMTQMAGQNEKCDVVFMDPPRAGSDEAFLNSCLALAPKKIVYISCNPETLARDLAFLTSNGYSCGYAYPVDMFPWTGHVETVCLLSKLHEAKHHVSVKLDMDEMDITSAESKATYEEIKKYVAEHNDGMKVSSLNIAQVKRKCGLELAENFNLPKSENSRQPKCPKKKEEAIMEALKAFQMI